MKVFILLIQSNSDLDAKDIVGHLIRSAELRFTSLISAEWLIWLFTYCTRGPTLGVMRSMISTGWLNVLNTPTKHLNSLSPYGFNKIHVIMRMLNKALREKYWNYQKERFVFKINAILKSIEYNK